MTTLPEISSHETDRQSTNLQETRISHEVRLGMGRFAVEQIARRDEYAEKLAEARTKLEELDTLQKGGLVSRLRQRRALKSWLQRHEFPNHKFARNILTQKQDYLQRQHEEQQDATEVELGYIRRLFGTFSEGEKEYADLYLRHHGLPEEIIRSCDSTADNAAKQRNLIDWLAAPEENVTSENASTEELEKTLIWNALHTESIAANTELVSDTIARYNEATQRRVREGKLDASFMDTSLAVDKVIVGDILDRRFLGYDGQARMGEYFRREKALAIWPYELPGETGVEEVVSHELTHAKGGFETSWIDEAYTERFNLIIKDLSPDQASNVYTHDRFSIKTLQEAAPDSITDKIASACYVGSDPALNEQRLREEYKRAYRGIDVLGIVNEAYENFTNKFTDKGIPIPAESRHNGLSAVVLASLHISYLSQKIFEDPQLANYAEEIFRKRATETHEAKEVEVVAYSTAANFYAQIAHDFKNGRLAPAPTL